MANSGDKDVTTEELTRAVADLARYLAPTGARYSISGGAASLLVRRQHGLPLRTTQDIDLVVQPEKDMNAESISQWLLRQYPHAFVAKTLYGVSIPAMIIRQTNGSVKHVEVEVFDVESWPQRPQYDLGNPANEISPINVLGVEVPVFSARWLLREKILTAYERRGQRKKETDIDDACNLVDIVEHNSLDLTGYEDAVQYLLSERPDIRQILEVKAICPNVLGKPWTWNEAAGVYWRLENDQFQYLDEDLERHEFEWDTRAEVWYLTNPGQGSWFYNPETNDLGLRA